MLKKIVHKKLNFPYFPLYNGEKHIFAQSENNCSLLQKKNSSTQTAKNIKTKIDCSSFWHVLKVHILCFYIVRIYL